jgi:hypothetical protein
MSEPRSNRSALPSNQGQPEQPLSLPQKLARVRSEQEEWARIVADPTLSPEAAYAARQAYRSSQAAVKLGEKALAWQQEQNQPSEQGEQFMLARALGMPSLPSQLQSGSVPNPDLPTGPGTSS